MSNRIGIAGLLAVGGFFLGVGQTTLKGDDMVLIPSGEFEMGDSLDEVYDNELPVHTVYLNAYYIDTYEVTNQQYADGLNWAWSQGGLIEVTSGVVCKYGTGTSYPYCDTTTSSSYSRITWNGSTFGVVSGKESHPMVMVSWYGSVACCNWRSAMEGKPLCYDLSTWTCDFGVAGYRLPTEAEWEKAAGWDPVQQRHFRFGEHTDGCGYNCLDGHRANYWNSGDPFQSGALPWTTPVGYYNGTTHGSYTTQNAQSYYGCYDMSGNVYEWCNDWYGSDYYETSPDSNPTGPVSGTDRVLRGGSCRSNRFNLRSAYRDPYSPASRQDYYGFRLALAGGPGNQPPVALFNWWPQCPEVGDTVTFDGSPSEDPDGTIALWAWDFENDGVYDTTGPIATHAYETPGVYLARLRVEDNDGEPTVNYETIVVGAEPPTVEITWPPRDGYRLSDTVAIIGEAHDPDGDDTLVAVYVYDVTDNITLGQAIGTTSWHYSWDTATAEEKQHTLMAIAYDGILPSNRSYVTVIVDNVPGQAPIANAGGPYEAFLGQELILDASASYDDDGTIELYRWDFENDGTWDTEWLHWLHDPTYAHTYMTEFTGRALLQVQDNEADWGFAVARVSTVLIEDIVAIAGSTATLLMSGVHGGEYTVVETLALGDDVVDTAIGDIDGDGREELLICTSDDIRLYNWKRLISDVVPFPIASLDTSDMDGPVVGCAIGDLNGNGNGEILIITDGGWFYDSLYIYEYASSTASIDRVSSFERYFAGEARGIYVGDGFNSGLPQANVYGSTLLLTLFNVGSVRSFFWDGSDYTEKTYGVLAQPVVQVPLGLTAVCIGDADNDGANELIVASDKQQGVYIPTTILQDAVPSTLIAFEYAATEGHFIEQQVIAALAGTYVLPGEASTMKQFECLASGEIDGDYRNEVGAGYGRANSGGVRTYDYREGELPWDQDRRYREEHDEIDVVPETMVTGLAFCRMPGDPYQRVVTGAGHEIRVYQYSVDDDNWESGQSVFVASDDISEVLITRYIPFDDELYVTGLCPIDVVVTDPEGRSIDKYESSIPGATYMEEDIDQDGEVDDQVHIPNAAPGVYMIAVVPEPDADPTEAFSVFVSLEGKTFVVARDVQIADIPSAPYMFSTGAPVVTCSVATDVLWAPDHHLVNVGLSTTVSADCDPTGAGGSLTIEVWSDETEMPDTGDGTGRHAPDAKDIDTSLRLRKERRGPEDGRVYLIIARAEDASGNVGFGYCTVVVPHDQSQESLDEVAAQAEVALANVEATPGETIAEKVSALVSQGWTQHGVSEELGPHQ